MGRIYIWTCAFSETMELQLQVDLMNSTDLLVLVVLTCYANGKFNLLL